MTFTTEQLYAAVLHLCRASAEGGLGSVDQFIDELQDPEQWAKQLFNEYVVLMSQPK